MAEPLPRSMPYYNAIVLNENKEPTHRINVIGLGHYVPRSRNWIVRHKGKRLNPHKTINLENSIVSPTTPITIIKRKPYNPNEEIKIKVITWTRKVVPLTVIPEMKVEEVKKMMADKEGIPAKEQRLMFYGKQLADDCRLVDYDIIDRDELHLTLRLIGGGGLTLKDLEGNKTSGTGKPMKPNRSDMWKGYSAGFNIIGKCRNPLCVSQKSRRYPVFNDGYGEFFLFSGDPLICPACKMTSLKPRNFLVAGGRASVKFRKSGSNETKLTLLESPGECPQYVILAESNKDVDYDEVEVMTVPLEESPFTCSSCGDAIIDRSFEVAKDCGHYFHMDCADETADCIVCICKDDPSGTSSDDNMEWMDQADAELMKTIFG